MFIQGQKLAAMVLSLLLNNGGTTIAGAITAPFFQ
jgi:hypothetical protein